MFPVEHFVLVMRAKYPESEGGETVEVSRQVVGDETTLIETANVLCRLAFMDGLVDIHIAKVYSKIPEKVLH